MKYIRNRQEILYFLIPIGVFISMSVSWLFKNYYSPDSYSYISLASNAPKITNSIFPLLYPLTLKLVKNLVLCNFDYSAKIINLLSVGLVFYYTKKYNFFWKEIWVILTFSPFLDIFPFVWSEILLLPFLVIYSHINYQILNMNEDRYLPIKNGVTMFLLVIIKYNSLFLICGTSIFAFLLLLKQQKPCFFKYLFSLVISVSLVLFYLGINYWQTGFIMGERNPLKSMEFNQFFFYSLINVVPSIDPFFYSLSGIAQKMKNEYSIRYITFLPYLLSYFIIPFWILKIWPKNMNGKINFFEWLVINSFSFLILTFISAYYTDINTLGSRLLLGFYFFLLLAMVIKTTKFLPKLSRDKILLWISFTSILLNVLGALLI